MALAPISTYFITLNSVWKGELGARVARMRMRASGVGVGV
jgi:hypothetical protein